MSSFDKVVKLACKPKAAPPKAKYLDPIIAATWSEDGAVHDVCKALAPRLREPNAIIVFKALIVLHTMIRNGATDNVLAHLSSTEVLRLRNVSAGNWEGYNAPQNLQHYAIYLDSRIRAYRDLKHDAIRVQAETNRDMRVNNSIEEDLAYGSGPATKSSTKSKGPQRSKTIMGRKLRVMTVEKGLLRETKTVQKMIDTLVECRFYLDDLEDELTITALRMLVKDLLILFQAGNEGVINVLEHYFEMSKIDAEQALAIYRHFCKQTERVVEYLGVAKKLQNLLNVSIPNLKHAPVSLAGALQEYLNDPNFDQNRIEYKASKEAADKNGRAPRNGSSSNPAQASTSEAATASTSTQSSQSASAPIPPATTSSKPDPSSAMMDFFTSIEEDQPTIFNPHTGSPTTNYFHQQAAHNPFVQRQMTGAFPSQPAGFPSQLQAQSTGFPGLQSFQSPQPNAFGLQPPQSQPQHRPFSTFLQSQATGFPPPQATGFLQPQATGANPFRQSVLLPQGTGMPQFNTGVPLANAFAPQPQQLQGQQSPFPPPNPSQQQPFGQASAPPPNAFANQLPSTNMPFGQPGPSRTSTDLPARPASTPLTAFGSEQPSATSPPTAQPVKSHQTGSRNPFGVPVTPAPPVPKPPTLMELAMGIGGGSNNSPTPNGSQPLQPQQTGAFGAFGTQGSGFGDSSISSIASSFAFKKSEGGASALNNTGFGSSTLNHQSTPSGSTASDSVFSSFSPMSSQPTGATVTSSAPSISISSAAAPLKPQTTGFGGVKAFKPTSSFGASLLESLPPIPQSGPTTPDVTGKAPATASSTGANPGSSAFGNSFSGMGQQSTGLGALNAQPTGALSSFPRLNGGSTVGVGLRPQATGAMGGANPFRASMFTGSGGGPGSNGSSAPPLPSSTSTPQFGAFGGGTNGASPFGAGFGGSGAFSNFNPGGQDPLKQPFQQQNGGASLI
ncbi:ANTH-domain-containing protein [Leucogyrophana mollusca]|uniref:ANTH-domain-containing protein n=1 Tax=Leucogyrophana mollusca TaxID=85980 RepID=A0ACB8B9A8_9AGAM|nr:ANTH-domain-containing protein [Leucogyrophana mollusca]